LFRRGCSAWFHRYLSELRESSRAACPSPLSFVHVLSAAALLAVSTTACRRQEISVYDVPKESKASSVPSANLPAGWQELPADQMRVGNYVVRGKGDEKAEVTVIPLPGGAGSELDNVNRWRGQIGLAAQTQEQIDRDAVSITIAGHPARLFDLAGTNRMLAAWQDHGGSRWFFKMKGADALVQQQKSAFLQFCENYRYPDSTVAADSPNPHQQVSAAADTSAGPEWNAPAEWKSQTPGPMQDAKFSTADGKAVITISIFEGTTGGLLANVNRWRGQLELAPVDEAGLSSLITSLDSSGQEAKLVDMNGAKQRMVAAIVPLGSKTAFFKLMGDTSSVGAEKDRFIAFVKSAK